MTVQEFQNEWNGKLVPSRNGITGQCVSLVQAWAQENGVGGAPVFPVPGAKDIIGCRPDAFDVIPIGQFEPGDIVCFDGRYGGGVGHTGMIVNADGNGMNVFQENDPEGSGAHLKFYNYFAVQGAYRIKGSKQGGHTMSPDSIDKAMLMSEGRHATQSELGNPDYNANADIYVSTLWNNGGQNGLLYAADIQNLFAALGITPSNDDLAMANTKSWKDFTYAMVGKYQTKPKTVPTISVAPLVRPADQPPVKFNIAPPVDTQPAPKLTLLQQFLKWLKG